MWSFQCDLRFLQFTRIWNFRLASPAIESLVGGFNPFEKYARQNGIIPPSRGENKQYLSCHHLVLLLNHLLDLFFGGVSVLWFKSSHRRDFSLRFIMSRWSFRKDLRLKHACMNKSYPPVNKHSNGKSPSWIGNTSSNGGFSIAMLDYRSV